MFTLESLGQHLISWNIAYILRKIEKSKDKFLQVLTFTTLVIIHHVRQGVIIASCTALCQMLRNT